MKPMTFAEYVMLTHYNAISNADELNRQPKPERLCGRRMPNDLKWVPMGLLIEIIKDKDVIKMLTRLYNVTQNEIETECATIVVAVINWTIGQLNAINEAFKSLDRPLTAEEIMAGLDSEELKGDGFSTVDWYAQRMGITNHNDAMKVSWVTYYGCAKEDARKAEIKRRLNEATNKNQRQ